MTDERLIHVWTPQGVSQEPLLAPVEVKLQIHVNGRELVQLAATPIDLEALVMGFLAYSGIISAPDEILALHLSDAYCADVWLTHDIPDTRATRKLLTSGCGGGIVLNGLYEPPAPFADPIHLAPELLTQALSTLQPGTQFGRKAHGMHTSALLSATGDLLALAEDIGRHNTLDKLIGMRLRMEPQQDVSILLTTGRVSVEMISKAAFLHVPVVASLKACSAQAIALAE